MRPGDTAYDDGDDDEDVMYVEPSVTIKQEILQGENEQESCLYDSSSQIHRPPPPLHHRPDPNDSRTSHPSGLDSEQLALAYTTSVKQEQDPDSGDMSYNTQEETIRMPHGMSKQHEQSANTSTSTDNLDMQAFPVDWGNQSAQDFMSGDDSFQQSPSNQASGSGGASQQVGV